MIVNAPSCHHNGVGRCLRFCEALEAQDKKTPEMS
jgi:hypothetical protein